MTQRWYRLFCTAVSHGWVLTSHLLSNFNWALKQMLGVRKTIPNAVCHAESGYPSLPDLVRYKQHKFSTKMWDVRLDMEDDLLYFAVGRIIGANTRIGKLVSDMIREDVPDMSELLEKMGAV